jgi:hypothetical protein
MFNLPLREFRRAEDLPDARITLNMAYVVSVAPHPAGPDQTVVRVTTGRGFEEYAVRGSYDQIKAVILGAANGRDSESEGRRVGN